MNNELQNDSTNDEAVNEFVLVKMKIDSALLQLQTMSEDHFDISPDELSWAHVDQLKHCLEQLRGINVFLNGETDSENE